MVSEGEARDGCSEVLTPNFLMGDGLLQSSFKSALENPSGLPKPPTVVGRKCHLKAGESERCV